MSDNIEVKRREVKVNYGTTRVLKWAIGCNGGNTLNWNLKYPKSTLTKAEVENLTNELITDDAILYKDNEAQTFKDAYIYETQTVEIPTT